MQKWEYFAIVQSWDDEEKKFRWGDDLTDERNVTERLNALGQEGWEVVAAYASTSGMQRDYYNYLLKRPIK
jgi:hypothetical protein